MADVEKPTFEVADIIRLYGDDYRNNHTLPPLYQGVLNAINNCRTAILGGHIEQCDSCGDQRISYNSCRNRHCPKCQGLDNVRWVEEREAELLPAFFKLVVA